MNLNVNQLSRHIVVAGCVIGMSFASLILADNSHASHLTHAGKTKLEEYFRKNRRRLRLSIHTVSGRVT